MFVNCVSQNAHFSVSKVSLAFKWINELRSAIKTRDETHRVLKNAFTASYNAYKTHVSASSWYMLKRSTKANWERCIFTEQHNWVFFLLLSRYGKSYGVRMTVKSSLVGWTEQCMSGMCRTTSVKERACSSRVVTPVWQYLLMAGPRLLLVQIGPSRRSVILR